MYNTYFSIHLNSIPIIGGDNEDWDVGFGCSMLSYDMEEYYRHIGSRLMFL